YRRAVKPLVPPVLDGAAAAVKRALMNGLPPVIVPYSRCRALALGGVVYTSIFNPGDGRKNWEDLISGFLWALGDRADVTLVLKLVRQESYWAQRVIDDYQRLGRLYRCRVAVVTEYLSDDQMLALCAASTYYVTTTRAEGNCLPVMNYLAAGRPAVSPCHSAI